jgi:beta-xylosidase
VTAEAGTFEHHMITVARSKDIWGPYESYEKNPILTALGTKEYVQNTGHGDLLQDQSGAWWLTCLGIRNDNGRYPLGRETFLTPVSWPKDGWPTVENATISFQREGVVATSSSDVELTQLKNLPRIDYLYIRDPNLEDYHFSTDDRRITITPSNSTLSAQLGTSSFVGKRQRALNCSAVVSLDISLNMKASGKSIQTGLALYKEDCRHTEIYYDFSKSAVCFRKELKMKGDAVVSQIPLVAMRNISFRIRAEPSRYEFEYRVGEGQSWTLLESMDTLEMTGLDFTGPILGIFASCKDVEDAIPIVFEDFEIDS